MSRLDDLIAQYCPDGVEYFPIDSLCEIRGRIGFRGYTKNDLVPENEGAITLSPSNIQNGIISFDKLTYISWKKYEESPEIQVSEGDIIFCKTASVGKVAVINELPEKATINPQLLLLKNFKCSSNYLCYLLKTEEFQNKISRIKGLGTIPTITQKDFASLRVPVPPLPVQQEIVRILDSFTNLTNKLTSELDAEKQVQKRILDYYSKQLFSKSENGKTVKLGEVTDICMCKRISKSQTSSAGDVPFYQNGTLGKKANLYITKELFIEYSAKYKFPKKNDVMLSTVGTVGRTIRYNGEPAYFQDSNIIWFNIKSEDLLSDYLYCYCLSMPWKLSERATLKHLHNYMISDTEITIPSIEEQKYIIKHFENLKQYSESLIGQISHEIEIHQKQFEYYRDKLLTFKEKMTLTV